MVFTGSTEAAQSINRQLAKRPVVPFIAETGGQNVLIADSSSLSEQLVNDALTSAFDAKRARLLPAGRRYAVRDLAAAMRRHASARGERVNLAWVLMSGINSGVDEAEELARLFRGVPVRLSIIDVNDPTGRFRRAGEEERSAFLSALGARHRLRPSLLRRPGHPRRLRHARLARPRWRDGGRPGGYGRPRVMQVKENALQQCG